MNRMLFNIPIFLLQRIRLLRKRDSPLINCNNLTSLRFFQILIALTITSLCLGMAVGATSFLKPFLILTYSEVMKKTGRESFTFLILFSFKKKKNRGVPCPVHCPSPRQKANKSQSIGLPMSHSPTLRWTYVAGRHGNMKFIKVTLWAVGHSRHLSEGQRVL